MAQYINNQPVFFGDASECSSDEISVVQLVDNTDKTQFQFSLSPCISAQEVIPDPIFSDPEDYVVSPGWSVSTSALCLTGSTPIGSSAITGTGGTTILSVFTADSYYQVTVVVTSISVGGSVDVMMGGAIIGTITSAGTFTFYGLADTVFFGYPLIFVTTVEDTNICISSVSALEILTNFIIAIYSPDGLEALISYIDNPEYFVFSDDTVTVTIDWAELELSNNCYHLCMMDPCVNTNGQNYPAKIENCEFTGNAFGWTLGSRWSYGLPTPNTVAATFGGSKAQRQLTQAAVFNSFTNTFCIEIVITAGTGSVTVQFGDTLADTISGVGSHIVCGIPSGNFDLVVTIASGSVTITSICPMKNTEYVCDMISNRFSLSDYSASCTLLIHACNNENGLGFNFNGSGFVPKIRLEAKLKQAKYPQERTIQQDSLGEKKVIYFDGRKAKVLAIDLQHEYVHDFLRLMGGFDNFYINNQVYFVEDDEYNVDYGDSDDIGKVNILVSTRTQNVKNINCSDTQNVCNLGENILLQADDLSQNVLMTNGENILINA